MMTIMTTQDFRVTQQLNAGASACHRGRGITLIIGRLLNETRDPDNATYVAAMKCAGASERDTVRAKLTITFPKHYLIRISNNHILLDGMTPEDSVYYPL